MDASPSRRLRIALAQINVSVGDLEGNTARIIDWIDNARASGCDLVAFPELAITGYPPEDLLLKPSFIHDNRHCLERVVAESTGIAVVCGFVDLDRDLFNAAAFAYNGELRGIYHKDHPAELRRVRRGALLPARPGVSDLRTGRGPDRPQHL